MARRPNYGFEKRQRELRKQKRKEEKAARKRGEEEAAEGAEGTEATEGGDPAGEAPPESGPSDRE